MADEQAGSVFVRVFPEADRAAFQTEIGKAMEGVQAVLNVSLKIGKGEVTELIAETDRQLAARKKRPTLYVDLKVNRGEATRAVREANAHIKTLKRPPQLQIGLSVTAAEARRAIREVNTKLKKAKAATPKIKVQLDLDEKELLLAREIQTRVRQIDATIPPVEIELDLDENSIKRVSEKAAAAYAIVQARMKAAHEARVKAAELLEEEAFRRTIGNIRARNESLDAIMEEHEAKLLANRLSREAGANARVSEAALKSQNSLNQKIAAGLDARSLEEIRQINRVALAHTRAELSKRTSSNVTLRQLRNDLGQFDASTTRVLRRLTVGFGIFTAGVTAAFAGIAIASLRSFAQTEQQLRRTAAVLGTDVFSTISAQGGTAEEAFAGFRKEVERTNAALSDTVNNVAVGTIFDPTEIASGTRALAQAGLQIEEIKTSLLGVAQFAQNEELLPEEAVASLVQGATAAGESLSDLRQLSDRFTFVANNTTATAKEVADAFANRAAPAFKAYGEEVKSTLAVLDLFAASGIRGKTAGEQAGILIREINKAAVKTPATTAAFKKYGIEVGKVNGQQVPFLKTLAQISTLLQNTRIQKGSLEYAKLRKELGLTEKSGAGLQQILTQVTKDTGGSAAVAFKNLQLLEAQIEKSTQGIGATARQATVINDTLSFQFDILSNNITTLFKQAAGPLGKALTGVFSELNGEVSVVNGEVTQTGGILDSLEKKFLRVGNTVANFVAPAIKDFATGGQGADFFGGVFEGFRGTLQGLVSGFREFRDAAFGEGSNKGFFTIMGDAFAGLGNFARKALPEVGHLLGTIVGFIRENTEAVELFIKAWLGLFVVSKALRLFVIPLVSVTENLGFLQGAMQGILGLKFASGIANMAAQMGLYTAATEAAAAATVGLNSAQGIAATKAAAASGKGAGKAGALAPGVSGPATAAVAAASLAPTNKLADAFKNINKIGRELGPILKKGLLSPFIFAIGYVKQIVKFVRGIPAALGAARAGGAGGFLGGLTKALPTLVKGLGAVAKFAGPIGLVIAAIQAVIGAVRGFVEGLKEQLDMNEKAKQGLVDLGNVLKGVIDVIGSILSIIGDVGASVGRFFGRLVGQILTSLGQVTAGIKEIFSGNFVEGLKLIGVGIANALTAPLRFALSFVIDLLADLIGIGAKLKIPGFKSAEEAVRGAARAVADFKLEIDEATESTKKAQTEAERLGLTTRQAGILSQTMAQQYKVAGNVARLSAIASKAATDAANASQQRSVVFIDQTKQANTDLLTAVGGFKPKFAEFDKSSRTAFNNAMSNATSMTASLLAQQATLQTSLGQTANAMNSLIDSGLQQALANAQAGIGALSVAQVKRMIADQQEYERKQKIQAAARRAAKDQQYALEALGGATAASTAATAADTAATEENTEAKAAVKTAAELATEAVEKMTAAQFRSAANSLIARINKIGGGYKASAREAAVLAKAIPLVDSAIQKQTDLVTKLDEALSKLQETQLAGTKAATDAAFAFDQQQKALELQKVNLQIAGAADDDPAVKAIDDQIAALQLQAQKAELEASIALDPLKKKLEETFSPVKELSFDQIIAQFQKLSKAKTAADANLGRTEALKKKLDEVAAASAERFSSVGLNVTKGIEKGLAAGNAALVTASKKTANAVSGTVKTQLGIASPSRVMAQVGVDTMTGFNNGINSMAPTLRTSADSIATSIRRIMADDTYYIAAGKRVMRGFQSGMNEVYTQKGGVQDFVKEIAVWIKDNKGPISYDAQLLRPAGEAMMSGFHGGLRDGFSEIKSWVRQVGPSLATDTFPKELFIERSARFLLNNSKADLAFNPEDAFGDLLPSDIFGGIGPLDPSLSFLHQTLSAADTKEMAQRLVKLFPSMNFNPGSSQFLRPEGTRTASGNISDHTQGTAADLGTGGPRPTAASLALFEKLKPLLGTVFKQLIHNGVGLTAGGGSFADSAHFDHIHAAWLKGPGFDKNSGKKGVGMLNIPGVPRDVLEAISVASTKYGFDPTIIAAVMKQESGFRKSVISGDGGYGLMQLTSSNLVAAADALGGRLDPVANALVGTKYLKDLIQQLGSLKLGLSAYNSGPGGGERYGRIDVPGYVSSVLRYLAEIRRQAGIGGRRAQGGAVTPGTNYLVGERGRELFVPEQRGSIITNKNVEALIAALQQGAQMVQPGAQQPVWAPQFHVASNSADPATVVALLEARMRAEVKGIRR